VFASLLVGGAAVAASTRGGIQFKVASPVTVQALGIDIANPALGQTVTAGAKIVAESDTVLEAAVIAVRDPDGKTVDFPDIENYKLGTSQKLFVQTGSFDKAGVYTYWFAFKQAGRWTGLDPRQTFTVGAGGPAPAPTATTPAPTTPAPTAAPTTAAPTTAPRPTASSGGGGTPGTGNPGGGSTALPGGGNTGCVANLAKCALPDASNTGVRAGTALSVINGDYTISDNGAVVDGKEIRGCVTVRAANVTIKNSKIVANGCFYGINNLGGGLTVSDVDLTCGNANGTGITATNFTVIRANIHGCENGLNVGGNVTVQDSYIHDLFDGNGAHTDGAQFNQGASNITFTHNTIISPAPGGTSAIIMWDEGDPQNKDVLISGNLLAGGTYTLYCPRSNSTNVRILNNRFGPFEYGESNGCSGGHVAAFTGNVKDGTGAPLGA
jgi:hypothetical protein